MNMLLVGVEEVSSCGLVRQQLVHARLFRAGFHSQLAYPQELIRAAIAVAYKAQVCLCLAGSPKSFDISICSCFHEFLCFYTACIGDELCLSHLSWEFADDTPNRARHTQPTCAFVHHTWPRIRAALYLRDVRQAPTRPLCKVWPYAHNATTCF